MSSESETKQLRIHIGNISPKLKENSNLLESRFNKFNFNIIKPFEFHTKPLELKYFAFITIETTNKEFEKFKNSLNGVVFMGLKLSINLAKPDFKERFKIIKDTPKDLENQIKQSQIVASRAKRIEESQNKYPTNSITSSISTAPLSTPIYSKSEHIYQNKSANTKNVPPTTRLNGSTSYGSTLNSLYYKYSNGKSHSVQKAVHRKTPRKELQLRSQTLRILINGELKQFKFYKTKLWGFDQNKTVRDLTFKYDNGNWKSGYDHIIETSCGINGKQALNYGKDTAIPLDMQQPLPSHVESEDTELIKNKSVLASILSNYDFTKPIEIEEDNGIVQDDIEIDSKGRKKVKHYDYEIEGKANEESDDEEQPQKQIKKLTNFNDVIQSSGEISFVPQKEIYYDEDDEGNDLDFDTLKPNRVSEDDDTEIVEDEEINKEEEIQDQDNEAKVAENKKSEKEISEESSEESEEEEEERSEEIESEESEEADEEKEGEKAELTRKVEEDEQEEEEEEEFIPTFGSNSTSNKTTSNTETLRSLFNPTTTTSTTTNINDQESNGFKLALSEDDEDIDTTKPSEDQDQLLKQIQKQHQQEQQEQQEQQDHILKKSKDVGLFWPHFESPFLSTQSQFSKIGNIQNFDPSKFQLPTLKEGDSINNGNEDETDYEKWFWSNRGEFSREFKRRRRDVIRILKKKQK